MRQVSYPWLTIASCFMLLQVLVWIVICCRRYSLAHAEHPINLLDAEPMENIGHQRLETHVLHTRNILGSLKVLRSSVQPTLSGIVD